jgi:hypothetical protein
MGILSKENIKKALENPFSFVIIFLLIIIALANSFALWCFIGAIIAIPFALFGKDSNSVIQFFCKDSSWKLKGVDLLSSILGKHTILIIVIGIILWALLNHTEKGKELLEYLD